MENPNLQTSMLFVYLTDKQTPKYQMDRDITELWNLTASLGDAAVVDLIVQKGLPFRDTYIGPGKAEEIAGYLRARPVDIITFNGTLSVNQKFNLTRMYWDINPNIQVWDRIDLILSIFSRHAHTEEAKLQIQLARMRHMGPSIYGMGKILSRQGGGIGTRGIGETNTELMKRHWRKEIKKVTDNLDKLTGNRSRQIAHRKALGLKTISLVGYTNAGKTSLFNLLTHKKKRVTDALFVTLDSVVGKIFIKEAGQSVVISDTIGFIRDLPPELIDAFKSTLLESVHADIVLHVIDMSDPEYSFKIDVVQDILKQLHISPEKIIFVFNKSDAAGSQDRRKFIDGVMPYPAVFLSATTGVGIDSLLAQLTPLLK